MVESNGFPFAALMNVRLLSESGGGLTTVRTAACSQLDVINHALTQSNLSSQSSSQFSANFPSLLMGGLVR